MIRALPFIAVALLVIVLVSVNRGAKAFLEMMGPEFAFGFLVGGIVFGGGFFLAYLYDERQKSKIAGTQHAAAQEKRARNIIDL